MVSASGVPQSLYVLNVCYTYMQSTHFKQWRIKEQGNTIPCIFRNLIPKELEAHQKFSLHSGEKLLKM